MLIFLHVFFFDEKDGEALEATVIWIQRGSNDFV